MAGISDLLGRNGFLEQLFLWNTVGEIAGTLSRPALDQLLQDVQAKHPVTAVDPATAADLAARGIWTPDQGAAEAALAGINAARWASLLDAHTVRLQPADLATLVLRSYLSPGDAQVQAGPQGVTPDMLAALSYLAGDALGPEQLAQAVRRGLIAQAGTGPDSTSYVQGIAESRLHDKWGPVLLGLSQVLLSPADAASAVVRNFLALDQGTGIAAKSGVPADVFGTLVHLSADAPGPQQLAEALRRSLIPADGTGAESISFRQGIAEGRLADKWAPVIQGLAKLWPTPADALAASVKGVFSAADGQAMYELLGGDPQFYQWLLYTEGDSPTPLEAAAMAARGIIAWDGTGVDVLSYAQAVKESRYRDKWSAAYRALAQPVPPPSAVVSMYSHAIIGQDQAAAWLADADLSADVAAAYLAEADFEAIADYQGLTQASVIDMYVGRTISRDQATGLLSSLHVSDTAAGLLLGYADMRYEIDSINRSVQRIATLFTSRKISVATATDALNQLNIPAASVEQIIETWELQAAASVSVLTYTQITDAFKYSVMSQADAMDSLEAIGYTPYDAWVILSITAKGPLPNPPPRIVAPPPGAVLPGTT